MVLCNIFAVQLTPYQQWIARWLALGLTVVAWMFAIVTVGSCTFVGLPGYSDSKGLGLFSVDINGSCVRYSRTVWFEPDGAQTAGQAFGTLTCLALSFAMLCQGLVIFLLRDRLSQLVWLSTRILLSMAFLCSMFTFSFYSSTLVADVCEGADDCALGPAGSVGVMNVWLLLGIFALSVCIPIPDEPILDVFDGESSSCIKDANNTSFETPKFSNEGRHEEATHDDEDLTNRNSSNNEDDVDVVSERFRSNLFDADPTNNNDALSRSLRGSRDTPTDLDEEAVNRAFGNPYYYGHGGGDGGSSVRASTIAGEDDPSIMTVSESNFSHFDRKFSIDPEAEEPSNSTRDPR